jgi:hypothetical protein
MSNTSGPLKLYWTTQNEQSFSEDKSVEVNYSTINQRKVLNFNLGSHPKWKNNSIKSLRLKMIGSGSIANVYNIYSNTNPIDTDGDGMSDYQETLICRNPSGASDFAIDFNTPYDGTSSWTTSGITNFSVNNGIASGSTKVAASYFDKKNLNFNGTTVPKLKIRIKANTTVQQNIYLYWENEDGTYFSTRFVSKSMNLGGAWQEREFDLSTNTNWIGKTIKSLRIVPVNAANINFEIDWLRSNNANTTGCGGSMIAKTASTATFLSTKNRLFEVSAYPNPFETAFNLNFETTSTENVSIAVYDMMGKLLETHKVNPSEVPNLQIGNHFTTGIYNVIVSQATEKKTIRLIRK